jgi:hypothetical protein
MATFMLLPSPSCASLLNKETSRFCSLGSIHSRNSKGFRVRAIKEKTEKIKNPSKNSSSPDEVTQKYGLEVGLWKVPISFSLLFWFYYDYVVAIKFQFHEPN